MKVYLAGPITGLSWGESEDWRTELTAIANMQGMHNVRFFSPLRGKEYLKNEKKINDSYNEYHMSTAKTIMLRDNFDVRTCDAVVANLMGAERVSIGTVMEIAWAYDLRIPVIAIMEPTGNVHEHSMLGEAIWWRVQNIEDALDCVRLLFNP